MFVQLAEVNADEVVQAGFGAQVEFEDGVLPRCSFLNLVLFGINMAKPSLTSSSV